MKGIERHFTVQEIAEMWKISTETVRRLFRDIPGVLKLGSEEQPNKRPPKCGYVILRIPESVLQKVHEERRV